MDKNHVRRLLKDLHKDVNNHGITQDDNNLANYYLVDGKLVMVDLELARDVEPGSVAAKIATRDCIQHLMIVYTKDQHQPWDNEDEGNV
jgi:hypothetical protein